LGELEDVEKIKIFGTSYLVACGLGLQGNTSLLSPNAKNWSLNNPTNIQGLYYTKNRQNSSIYDTV